MVTIDGTAPIVPNREAGGIPLYTSTANIDTASAMISSVDSPTPWVSAERMTFDCGLSLDCCEGKVVRILLARPYQGSYLGVIRPGVDLAAFPSVQCRLELTDEDLLTIAGVKGIRFLPEGELTFYSADDFRVGEIWVFDEDPYSLESIISIESSLLQQLLYGTINKDEYGERMLRYFNIRLERSWLQKGVVDFGAFLLNARHTMKDDG